MLSESGPSNHLLRVQVYDYLQEQMRIGGLEPGGSISVNTIIKELGISRTPLREALLLLQEQGFVTIQPQRGVKINALTLNDVKDIYEILGGIESQVILSVSERITRKEIDLMHRCNQKIESALNEDNIIDHNKANIDFHDVFLNLSGNERLLRYVRILKMQLYDFPRRNYGTKWNQRNLEEHRSFVGLLEELRPKEAADYMRDVHWKFHQPDSFRTL